MISKFKTSPGYQIVTNWMHRHNQQPFSFQEKAWQKYCEHYSGMVIAPTGYGKTFSLFLAVIIDYLNHPEQYKGGLYLLWITPLRSLAKDLAKAMQSAIDDMGLDWHVAVRNGDTDTKTKQQQIRHLPEILLTTPESWHLMLAQKDNSKFFTSIKAVVVDEWHELLSTKRGVMVELALSVFRARYPHIRIWGITATIGNLEEAKDVLLFGIHKTINIIAKVKKAVHIESVFPDEVDVLPWAGHLGRQQAEKVVDIILKSKSALLFTNTRNQAELWYQLLLDVHPDLAGQIALHHSSIDSQLRNWVEDSLSTGLLKAVVCTSSLDLGVDFKPVDTVIQIGSSKGVACFLQRAGRSGHSPYETSKIYFVPTHTLELIEVAGLKSAIKAGVTEHRTPLILCFDVLVQFLTTLALGEGFYPKELYAQIKQTFAFAALDNEEWNWCLLFITKGGKTGASYEEFHKVVLMPNGLMTVVSRKIAMLHRLNIGVIVGDVMIKVKFLSGGYIGMVEESFAARLKKGAKFILAGKLLEFIMLKDLTLLVKSSKGHAITPSWLGGRLPLTSHLSQFIRQQLSDVVLHKTLNKELSFLKPLFHLQETLTRLPKADEFLVEYIHTKEGYHLFFYPFEGRLVHEVMAALIAYRISRLYSISFSMAMNDYGFELMSDQPIHLSIAQLKNVLSSEQLMADVVASINATEMARRKFRDIAVIAGLVVQNQPGKSIKNKSLQASSGTIFNMLEQYDPQNLLLRQAYNEVFNLQMEEMRLRAAMTRINNSTLLFENSHKFSPLSFPIKVDSLRQNLSSEDLSAKIQKLILQHKK